MVGQDTSPAAQERQRDVFRRMTPAQRLQAAAEMSEEVRALAEAGIRQRNPGYSETEVRAALVELLVGRAAFSKNADRDPGPR